MKRREFFQSAAPLMGAGVSLAMGRTSRGWPDSQTARPTAWPAAGADGWISLINGRNFDGLYTMLQRSGKGVAEKKGMVTFENGMLHIMGNQVTDEPAESGYIATNQEFENYRLRAEYKFGVKRSLPRLEVKRDNGLRYHLVGDDKVWPTCVECQAQEGDVGDFFLLGGTRGAQGGNRGAGAGRGAGATPGRRLVPAGPHLSQPQRQRHRHLRWNRQAVAS